MSALKFWIWRKKELIFPNSKTYKIQSTKYETLLSLLMSALKFWICWMKERGPSGLSHMWIMLWRQVTFYNIIKHKIQNTAKNTQKVVSHKPLCALWQLYCWKPCSISYMLSSLIQYIGLHLKKFNAVNRSNVQREVYGGDIPCKVGSTDFHIVTNLWQSR